jgi:NAD-dependent dihydropyrimidine dehydrogenase PreA subunit
VIDRVIEKKCIGCGVCVEVCPTDVFEMVTEVDRARTLPSGRMFRQTKAVIARREDCMTCFLCEMACPTGALEVGFDPPAVPPILPAAG